MQHKAQGRLCLPGLVLRACVLVSIPHLCMCACVCVHACICVCMQADGCHASYHLPCARHAPGVLLTIQGMTLACTAHAHLPAPAPADADADACMADAAAVVPPAALGPAPGTATAAVGSKGESKFKPAAAKARQRGGKTTHVSAVDGTPAATLAATANCRDTTGLPPTNFEPQGGVTTLGQVAKRRKTAGHSAVAAAAAQPLPLPQQPLQSIQRTAGKGKQARSSLLPDQSQHTALGAGGAGAGPSTQGFGGVLEGSWMSGIVLCGSGLDASCREDLKKLAIASGARLVENFSPLVTHVVCFASERVAKRTHKYLLVSMLLPEDDDDVQCCFVRSVHTQHVCTAYRQPQRYDSIALHSMHCLAVPCKSIQHWAWYYKHSVH